MAGILKVLLSKLSPIFLLSGLYSSLLGLGFLLRNRSTLGYYFLPLVLALAFHTFILSTTTMRLTTFWP